MLPGSGYGLHGWVKQSVYLQRLLDVFALGYPDSQ